MLIDLFLSALSLHCCAWLSQAVGHGLLAAVASLVEEHSLWVQRLPQLWHVGSRSTGSTVVAHLLSCPKVVGSSRTRDQTHVPCIGRWTPNHRTKGSSQDTCFSRTLPLLINSWPSIFSVILLGSEFPLWGVIFPGAFM